jgi:hypothetical protein
MREEWRQVPGFPAYEVSSIGRVRSLPREVAAPFGSVAVKKGRMLSAWTCKSTGYPQVMLSDRRKHNVHRLVAGAFIPNPEPKPQVNHINGDRADNRLENLEWVTASENIAHSFRVLGRRNGCVGKFGESHPTSKAVISTCLKTGTETRYGSAMDAVRAGFDSGCISRCAAGHSRSHRGHAWRLENAAA